MKYVTLSGSLFLFFIVSCSKSDINESEIPVSKAVEFRMAQAADYSAATYDGVQAEVRLTISKQISETVDPVILWDTLIPYQSLRLYPVMATPSMITKQFNDVFESKETIRFSKIVRYKTASNQLSLNAVGEDIPSSVTSKLVEVNL